MLRVDRMRMMRDDDSQRRDRLTVTSATDVRAVDGLPRTCDSVSFGVRRIRMKRRDDSQRRDRLAVRQPVHTSYRSRTARADRAAGGFGFSTGVAAGYVWRRLSPYVRSLTTATVLDPRPPAHRRKNRPPSSPVNHIRGSADHRAAWRSDAGPDVRRAVGDCIMGRTGGSHLTSIAGPRQAASVRHLAGHPVAQETSRRRILKEPTRARPGPGESPAVRFNSRFVASV